MKKELTDLTIRRPGVGPEKPIRRPSSTTTWHVLDVGDEQAMGIRVVAVHAHGRAAQTPQRPLVGGVDAHSRGAIDSCGVSISLSYRSVDVLNMPVCRITLVTEEVEVVEEISRKVLVY